MATDFERSQWVVAGRNVAITSWRDAATHTWTASAPTFCHMLSADDDAAAHSTSRAAAIERVLRELKVCLERPATH